MFIEPKYKCDICGQTARAELNIDPEGEEYYCLPRGWFLHGKAWNGTAWHCCDKCSKKNKKIYHDALKQQYPKTKHQYLSDHGETDWYKLWEESCPHRDKMYRKQRRIKG